MFYNIPDDSKKLCRMSHHCKSSQTESVSVATSKCIKSQHNVTTARHKTHVAQPQAHDKTVDLSACDKFLACDVTSLIYCVLDP